MNPTLPLPKARQFYSTASCAIRKEKSRSVLHGGTFFQTFARAGSGCVLSLPLYHNLMQKHSRE